MAMRSPRSPGRASPESSRSCRTNRTDALELPRDALRRTWDSLREVGNLSSASVLFVFRDLLDSGEARPGDLGLLIAMGPGFCSELVLLRW